MSDREKIIRDVLLKVRPPYANKHGLQAAWREGVAQGVTETLIDEQKRIAEARAEDQQRLFHLEYAVDRYVDGIREHRDARGDDRCWRDDEALYKLLPEGYVPPQRDTAVELKRCEQFIACRQNPATEYVSPQREIERLQAEVKRLQVARIGDAENAGHLLSVIAGLKQGTCWCEMGIGNPMVSSHSEACRSAAKAVGE